MRFSKHTTLLTCLLLLGMPTFSHAFQPHSAPEGLYVHQIAHLVFICALAYLHIRIGQSTMLVSRGWHYLRLFCLILLTWNLLAFGGHVSNSYLSETDFANMGTWQSAILYPITPIKALYFLTRLEHLVYVPAMLCLFLAMRLFYHEISKEVGE